MSFLRLLRERWVWWLVPLVLTLGVVAWVALTRPPAASTMPMEYDLPTRR